jgi:hypothetical protein
MPPPNKKRPQPPYDPYGIIATAAAQDESRGKFVHLETYLAALLVAVGVFLAVHIFSFGPPRLTVASEIQISLENANRKAQKQRTDQQSVPGSETSDVDYLPRIGKQPVLLISIASDVDTVRISDVVSSENRPTMRENASPDPMLGKNPGCFDLTTGNDTPSGYSYVVARDLRRNQYSLNSHDPKHQTNEPFISVNAKTLTPPRSGFLHTLICTTSTQPSAETDTERVVRFRNFGQLNFRSNLFDEHASNVEIVGDGVTTVSGSAALIPYRRNDTYYWTDDEAAAWHENATLLLGIILGLLPTLVLDIVRFRFDMSAKKHALNS